MTARKVVVTYPASKQMEVSRAIAAVAESRTRHLHRRTAFTAPADLLVDAYLQGVGDTMETLDRRGLLK